jgi:hypothetical protein
MQLRFLNYDYQRLLKKKINLTLHSSNVKFWKKKKKKPPMQLCTFIILYLNMKMLKTPNNLTMFEYP